MSDDSMSTIDIPEELRHLCALAELADEESYDLFPPPVVSRILNESALLLEEANVQFLAEWLENRQMLWDRRDALLERLPVGTKDDIPLWMVQPFALTLTSTWGTGLAKAIKDCEAWLKSQST